MTSSDMMQDLEQRLRNSGMDLPLPVPVIDIRVMSRDDYRRVVGFARDLESHGFVDEAQGVLEQLRERLTC